MNDRRSRRTRLTGPYLLAVLCIFGVTSGAWLYLGRTMDRRTDQRDVALREDVGQIWGQPQVQRPPTVCLLPQEGGGTEGASCATHRALELRRTRARADLALQHRRKGLLWYATYRVVFDGRYTVKNSADCGREAEVTLELPGRAAFFDDLRLDLGDEELPVRIADGRVHARFQLAANASQTIRVRYLSRGLDRWAYALGSTTARARDFQLVVNTDFGEIDFPDGTLSPSEKQRVAGGWRLTWRFNNLISDSPIAVQLPARINPGPLAAQISRFAPISLLFFFSILLLVSVLRDVRLHPVHYGMLAAAFFAFHLLLAYSVDHLPLWLAFAIAAGASVGLVISYLRLAVGPRFAWLWAGGTQLCYLVLFSLAFFLEGYTGLTITVFSVLTLFVVMQLTGRIDWTAVLARRGAPPPDARARLANDSDAFSEVG